MLLNFLASTATVLACLLTLPMGMLSIDAGPSRDGGLAIGALRLPLALLPCPAVAYGVGLHRRAFDWVLRDVQAADPVRDSVQLLPPSSAHEEAPIRTLA